MSYNILAISGSFRKGSLNTALVHAFKERAPEGMTIEIADFNEVPLFNQDHEKDLPQSVADLKAKIAAADGIIIATPEYNRAMPGVLKNMIDYTSRPYGTSPWAGKPALITGATGGAVGTALAQANVRIVLQYLNVHVLGQPEFYLGGATTKFDEQGNLTDDDTKKHIDSALSTLAAFIDKLR